MILLLFTITKLNISKDLITAGEIIEAKLNLKDSINISLSFNDSDLIEINEMKINKSKQGYDYLYKLTSYHPGEKKIYLLKDKDTLGLIEFKVKSLLKGDETDIVDIKEPLNVFNPYYLFLLLIIPFVAFLIFIFKRPKRKKKIIEEITIPPEEEALSMLEKAKDMIEKDLKIFFFNISEIFRIYIEKKFRFPAIESTTTEISQYIKKLKLSELNEFVPLMKRWDIYKFTEIAPDKKDAEESFNKVKEFINAHR